MKTDHWQLIEEVFQRALQLPRSHRVQYLKQTCGDDTQLRLEVESLLDSDNDAETIIRSVISDDLKEMARISNLSEIGLHVGPYLLVRELDSGGMGVVYLAVRSDDQYFQIVAIKMIRKGFDSPERIQRFRIERQILATLNHPNIGAILDGGETGDGRPFIVMEYVEGQPITLASKNRALSIRQRIELFRSVCAAVHYAHQKLIIHRDIKPSNIMVTPEGIVKLIDFGISKALASPLTQSDPSQTASGFRLMTPDYASPEQIQGKQLTTATDVYSLGVLLFELLTGSRPYTLRELSPAAAERAILERDNQKPSSVSDLSKRARREISGDVDRIVLMAMDRDPSRRYLSVQHLNEDLLRYLQGKPISARKTSTAYQIRKFVQRHKTVAWTACAILVTLSISSLVYLRQSRVADLRVKRIRALADSAISDMTDKLQDSSTSTETQAALLHSALKYLGELRRSTGDDPRLLRELSKAYMRVGDLEGSPLVANLGNSEAAVMSFQEASRIALQVHARMPDDETTKAVIETYQRLGGIESFLGNLHEANDNYRQSLSWARGFWQQSPQDPIRKRLLAMTYAGLGNVSLYGLAPDQALQEYLAAFQILGNSPDGVEDHDKMLIELYLGEEGTLNELGKQSEALADGRKAIATAEALVLRFPSSVQVRRQLFIAYVDIIFPLAGRETLNVSDSVQAQTYARRALAIAQMLAGTDDKNAQALFDLALAYAETGDSFRQPNPATAAAWYRKAISLTQKLAPRYGAGARHWTAIRNEALADVLRGEDEAPERLRLLLEANRIRRELAETSPHGRLHLMRSYCKLSDAELALKNPTKARQYANSALPLLNEFDAASPSLLVLRDVGFCYESEGAMQHHMAVDQLRSSGGRIASEEESRRWYQKSADVWATWNRRGVATRQSERKRLEVERLLKMRFSDK